MRATIDRIDEGIAVLILNGDEPLRFHLPVSLLPPDSREGDIITVALERDAGATEAAKERTKNLIAKLRR